jgi:hypothetical protein
LPGSKDADAAHRRQAPRLPKLKTREVVPRSLHPNFRDHGRMVDGPLLHVLSSLVKKHGEAFASEAGLRRMICEDSGHMPGVDTIPCALERLEATGILTQRWLKPGGLLPDGSPCTFGTRLVVLPQCRQAKRGLVSRARREGVTQRPDRRALGSLTQARASIAAAFKPPPAPPAPDYEQKKADAIAAALELERQWARERDPDKPPS